jgi:hypothetical protein
MVQAASASGQVSLILVLAAVAALAVAFIVFLDDGNGIDPGEPAMQIDVRAAARAEWAKLLFGRFAANRARLASGVGHAP